MNKQTQCDEIRALIETGKTEEAILRLDSMIARSEPPLDYLYYLRGNARRKMSDWPGAINNYLKAMEINPESPAREAYRIAVDIQDFFNKDMYNQ